MPEVFEQFVGLDGETIFPWAEFQKMGLLWLINATVFNPRGYHLTMYYTDDTFTECTGFKVVGDGKSPWSFPTNNPGVIKAFKSAKQVLK